MSSVKTAFFTTARLHFRLPHPNLRGIVVNARPNQLGLVGKRHGHGHSRLGHLEFGPELVPHPRGAGTVAPEEGSLVGLQQPRGPLSDLLMG